MADAVDPLEEQALLQAAKGLLARATATYLGLAYSASAANDNSTRINKFVLIAPGGIIAWWVGG